MNKIFTQKLIIAIALVCFIFIPSKSYADVVSPPNLPGYYSGGKILLIMIAIIVLVAFCFFIVKEEYKKERIMKVLKKIVIVLEYFLIVWFAYSTAENLIVYANYYGNFGVKRNLVDLIFLFLLTAIVVISMIFLAQKNKRKSIKTVKFGCTIILIVFFNDCCSSSK